MLEFSKPKALSAGGSFAGLVQTLRVLRWRTGGQLHILAPLCLLPFFTSWDSYARRTFLLGVFLFYFFRWTQPTRGHRVG